MPQGQEGSQTKTTADFVAPKIIKTSSAFRQPLSTINAKQNFVRKNNKFKSRPLPSKILITKRLNRNTVDTTGKTTLDPFQIIDKQIVHTFQPIYKSICYR